MKEPMDVLRDFPVRKSRKQKQKFRDAVIPYLESMGYFVKTEKGSFGSRNILIGRPESAEYLITAHYDTCAELPFPNFITPCSFWGFLGYQLFLIMLMFALAAAVSGLGAFLLPDTPAAFWGFELTLLLFIYLVMFGPANPHCTNDNTSGVISVLSIARALPDDQKDKVAFILFDLEEEGLIGSASYAQRHKKEIQNQINLNLDCVGDGDYMMFFPTKKMRKDPEKMALLEHCKGSYGPKVIRIRKKGFSVYPSDQVNFPYGVGICALRKKYNTLYLGRIHTRRDTILEQTNVNLLQAAIISMISCGAAK